MRNWGRAGVLMLIGCCAIRSASAFTLTWAPSPDTNVVGYYVYSGTSSGTYTRRIDVGNATSTTFTALLQGPTNYLVATAYDAEGTESDPSNEAVFVDGGGLQTTYDANNQAHLFMTVYGGYIYDLQYSTTLNNWTLLAMISSSTNGTYETIDPNSQTVPQRFYRLRLH